MTDDISAITQAGLELGRQALALKVLRWLRENVQDIPDAARDELLTILGVEK